MKNILFRAICWIAVIASASTVKAQVVDRTVDAIDASVHARIEDETLPPETSQPSGKKQTDISVWAPEREKQSLKPPAGPSGISDPLPGSRASFQPENQPRTSTFRADSQISRTTIKDGKSKQPILLNGSPFQHMYDGLTGGPLIFKAAPVPAPPEPKPYEWFTTFDRRPLGLLNDYSLPRTEFLHREGQTTNLGQHKVRRTKSINDHHSAGDTESHNNVKHSGFCFSNK